MKKEKFLFSLSIETILVGILDLIFTFYAIAQYVLVSGGQKLMPSSFWSFCVAVIVLNCILLVTCVLYLIFRKK